MINKKKIKHNFVLVVGAEEKHWPSCSRLMSLVYPGERTSLLCEHIAKDYFIASLGDRDFEFKIREREPRDTITTYWHNQTRRAA